MSDPEPIELSAKDLMASWVTELEGGSRAAPGAGFLDFEPSSEEFGRGSGSGKGRGRGPRGPQDRPPPRGKGGPSRDRRGDDRPPRQDRQGHDRDRERKPRHGKGPRSRGESRRGESPESRDPLPPPNISAHLKPEPAAAAALASHIRATCRAYPLVDVARVLLADRTRFQVAFRTKQGKEDGAHEGQSLVRCKADGSLWLSREEAMAHALQSDDVLSRYYRIEELTVDPPRGNFTAIAVCGMSGEILGPPNYHQYQPTISRLHRERFSRMPIDRYRSRIEMRHDEETLARWKDQMSRARHYTVLAELPAAPEGSAGTRAPESLSGSGEQPVEPAPPLDVEPESSSGNAAAASDTDAENAPDDVSPAPHIPDEFAAAAVEPPDGESESEGARSASSGEEDAAGAAEFEESQVAEDPAPVVPNATVLKSPEELARHFRLHHADDPFEIVSDAIVSGNVSPRDLSRPLLAVLRSEVDNQRKFPLQLMQELSRRLEKTGLRIFRIGKKTLFVAVARPREIDPGIDLSERVQRIIDFLAQHPGVHVTKLLESLVPGFHATGEGEKPAEHSEQEIAVLTDLRWLTREGYVIEFSSGNLQLGRAPARVSDRDGGRRARGQPSDPPAQPTVPPGSNDPPPGVAEPEPEPGSASPDAAESAAAPETHSPGPGEIETAAGQTQQEQPSAP